jgi:hypothetical protein
MVISRPGLLRVRNVSEKFVKNQNTLVFNHFYTPTYALIYIYIINH